MDIKDIKPTHITQEKMDPIPTLNRDYSSMELVPGKMSDIPAVQAYINNAPSEASETILIQQMEELSKQLETKGARGIDILHRNNIKLLIRALKSKDPSDFEGLLKNDPDVFKLINPKWPHYAEIALTAIGISADVYGRVAEKYQKDSIFINKALNKNPLAVDYIKDEYKLIQDETWTNLKEFFIKNPQMFSQLTHNTAFVSLIIHEQLYLLGDGIKGLSIRDLPPLQHIPSKHSLSLMNELKQGRFFRFHEKEFENNPEIQVRLDILMHNPNEMQYIEPELKSNPNFILAALRSCYQIVRNGQAPSTYYDPQDEKEPNRMLAVYIIRHASDSLKNSTFLSQVINNNVLTLKDLFDFGNCLDESLLVQISKTKDALGNKFDIDIDKKKHLERLKGNSNEAIEYYAKRPWEMIFLNTKHENYKTIVFGVVRNRGSSICFIKDKTIANDVEITRFASINNGMSLRFMNEKDREKMDIALNGIKTTGEAFVYAGDILKKNPQFLLECVTLNANSAKHVLDYLYQHQKEFSDSDKKTILQRCFDGSNGDYDIKKQEIKKPEKMHGERIFEKRRDAEYIKFVYIYGSDQMRNDPTFVQLIITLSVADKANGGEFARTLIQKTLKPIETDIQKAQEKFSNESIRRVLFEKNKGNPNIEKILKEDKKYAKFISVIQLISHGGLSNEKTIIEAVGQLKELELPPKDLADLVKQFTTIEAKQGLERSEILLQKIFIENPSFAKKYQIQNIEGNGDKKAIDDIMKDFMEEIKSLPADKQLENKRILFQMFLEKNGIPSNKLSEEFLDSVINTISDMVLKENPGIVNQFIDGSLVNKDGTVNTSEIKKIQEKIKTSENNVLRNWQTVSHRIERDYQSSFAQIIENKKNDTNPEDDQTKKTKQKDGDLTNKPAKLDITNSFSQDFSKIETGTTAPIPGKENLQLIKKDKEVVIQDKDSRIAMPIHSASDIEAATQLMDMAKNIGLGFLGEKGFNEFIDGVNLSLGRASLGKINFGDSTKFSARVLVGFYGFLIKGDSFNPSSTSLSRLQDELKVLSKDNLKEILEKKHLPSKHSKEIRFTDNDGNLKPDAIRQLFLMQPNTEMIKQIVSMEDK